ncbi:MAG: hypothetical protein PHC43_01075 [Candidatus Marinimicrobia bacterium]|jgi:hypothetical protein|nr:hypothetical protein [Candidatus Neomarinimicrobiota bacterium]MDD5229901.1 hypothetical protein [Candidatus Neomarinimicrobiota bacterium]MDD5539869.1 hypothetical protein [Candidatus Neomarinimicrobiota bacterium]
MENPNPVSKLEESLKSFSAEQLSLLIEKHQAGFAGWDDPVSIPNADLVSKILEQAITISNYYLGYAKNKPINSDNYRRRLLHIANYAMFLYQRESDRLLNLKPGDPAE